MLNIFQSYILYCLYPMLLFFRSCKIYWVYMLGVIINACITIIWFSFMIYNSLYWYKNLNFVQIKFMHVIYTWVTKSYLLYILLLQESAIYEQLTKIRATLRGLCLCWIVSNASFCGNLGPKCTIQYSELLLNILLCNESGERYCPLQVAQQSAGNILKLTS